jgi:hypothetical protein
MRVQGTLLFGAMTVLLTFGSASAPRPALSDGGEMVQYVQSSKLLSPDGTTSSPSVTIVTASAQRERTDDQFGTYVIECDRQRTIDWHAQDKSYVVETFQELAQTYAAVEASMRANGEIETVATVHDAPDAKTMMIDGLTANHLIETVIGLPNTSLFTSVSDAWYAPGANPFVCPALEAIAPQGHRITTSTSSNGGVAGSGIVDIGTISDPRVRNGSIVLRESTRMGVGMSVITEVTVIKRLPYDPTYFEPPPGFVQASPRPLPSFSPKR